MQDEAAIFGGGDEKGFRYARQSFPAEIDRVERPRTGAFRRQKSSRLASKLGYWQCREDKDKMMGRQNYWDGRKIICLQREVRTDGYHHCGKTQALPGVVAAEVTRL